MFNQNISFLYDIFSNDVATMATEVLNDNTMQTTELNYVDRILK